MEFQFYLAIASFLSMALALYFGVALYKKSLSGMHIKEKLDEKTKEIVKQAEEIEIHRQKLAECVRVKDKLISVLAHDLRSPFATLESLMMLYEFEEYDQSQIRESMMQIRSLSNSTLQTMENALDWAKIRGNNGYKIQSVNFKINTLVDELIDFSSDIVKSKNISFNNEIDIGTEVNADINQVRIIIRNLISNAIKFSHEGNKITLSAQSQDNMVRIVVKDAGTGIPEDKLGKLFNMDTHFSTQGTKHEKGAGLGLLVSKELVEKNKGTIFIESKVNEGSVVSFTLPKSVKYL